MNINEFQKNEISLINSSVLFSGMDDTDINNALTVLDAKVRTYSKGEFLHRSHTVMNAFGMVLSGIVQACMDDIEGNRIIMAEVVPGATFGESVCFLEIKDSPVYIFASEPAKIMWFSVKNLFQSGADNFTLNLQKRFTAMLATRTLTMNNRIQVLSRIKLRDKLITYFNQMSQASGSLTFQIPVNREDLATYMGTNRSALSRELSLMKKEGLIDYYKNTFRIIE